MVEKPLADITRIELTMLEDEFDEKIVEPGPLDEIIHELVPGSLITVIFGPIALGKR
jgi:hypothetical protein